MPPPAAESAAASFRFALDVPSPHEPRRYKVRPVADADRGALAELLRHAPGIDRTKPPQFVLPLSALRLGVFDDMRVLRGFVELRPDRPALGDWCIELMLIDPRHRRAGLGAALVRELSTRIQEAGASRIVLHVDESNANAARFWRRQGFAEIGRADGRLTCERCL